MTATFENLGTLSQVYESFQAKKPVSRQQLEAAALEKHYQSKPHLKPDFGASHYIRGWSTRDLKDYINGK